MTPDSASAELPLFPLQSVLFPGGLLQLKVFEARYLDLIGHCLRGGTPFGVVALTRGSEVRRQGPSEIDFETVGTRAEVLDVDSPQAGILQVRCRGGGRFEVRSRSERSNGLWIAEAVPIADDPIVEPPPALSQVALSLSETARALDEQGQQPFLLPYRFDDAGWVANRWCEILPIPLLARQRLMALCDPISRLQLVDEFLRSKGSVE